MLDTLRLSKGRECQVLNSFSLPSWLKQQIKYFFLQNIFWIWVSSKEMLNSLKITGLSPNFDNYWCHQFTGNLWIDSEWKMWTCHVSDTGHTLWGCFFFPVGVYFNLASESYFIQFQIHKTRIGLQPNLKGSKLFYM